MADVDTILDAVTTGVNALGLVLGADVLGTSKRKVPSAQETIDTLPHIVVSKAPKADEVERWAFRKDAHRAYVRIAVISSGKGDLVTNLPEHASVRDQLLVAFASKTASGATPALAGLDGLRDVYARPGEFLPIEEINRGYDYQLVEVSVQVVRARE